MPRKLKASNGISKAGGISKPNSSPPQTDLQAEIITKRFEGAPATGTIPPGYKPPTYDPKYDQPEYSFDALLAKFHRQTEESYAMEAEIKAENEARRISGEPPCQKIPDGYKPPTYDPKYDLPEYSFDNLLAKFHRQTQESYVMEAEIREEQRTRLLAAKKFQEARAAQEAQAVGQLQPAQQFQPAQQSQDQQSQPAQPSAAGNRTQPANRHFPPPTTEQQNPPTQS